MVKRVIDAVIDAMHEMILLPVNAQPRALRMRGRKAGLREVEITCSWVVLKENGEGISLG